MEEVGLMQARDTLGQIVDRAHHAGTPTRITRQGKRAAVVVSAEWYERAEILIAERDWLGPGEEEES
jgi:prevent-host-death family protein